MPPVPTPSSSHVAAADAGRLWAPLFVAWLAATASTLGALFLGEVMGIAPCVLCWYQRIFMFPLAVVLAVGLFPPDPRVVRYALPLAIAGWAVALYHLLLVHGIVPRDLVPCDERGVSCSEGQVRWLGVVTIPLLSLTAFTFVIAALFAARRVARQLPPP